MAKVTAELVLMMSLRNFQRGVKGAVKGFSRMTEAVKKHEEQLKSLRNKSAIAFAAITAAVTASVLPAKRLEDEIANALTLVDAQGDEFNAMKESMTKDALDLSKQLGVSADKIAVGFYDVLSTGAEAGTEGFRKLAVTAIKLGKVVGLETSQSVDALAKTIGAFKLELSDAERVADIFFNTSKKVTVKVPELTAAFKEAGPAAAFLGISIEDTSAILAKFAEAGTVGTQAGTTFKIMATRLAAATGPAADALERLGVKSFNLDGTMRPIIDILQDMQSGMRELTEQEQNVILKTIAGEEAFAKLGLLMKSDLSTLKDWSKEFTTGGVTSAAFTVKLETLTGQLGILKANLDAVLIPLGKQFIPMIQNAADRIKGILEQLQPWIERNSKLTATLIGGAGVGAGLIAALTTLALLLPKLQVAFIALNSSMGIVAISAAAIVAAIVLIEASGMGLKDMPATLDETNVALSEQLSALDKVGQEIDKYTKENEKAEDALIRWRKENTAGAFALEDLIKKYKKADQHLLALITHREALIVAMDKEREATQFLTETDEKHNAHVQALTQHQDRLLETLVDVSGWDAQAKAVERLNEQFDIFQENIEEIPMSLGDVVTEADLFFERLGTSAEEFGDLIAQNVVSISDRILETEALTAKTLLKIMGGALVEAVKMVIQAKIRQMIASRIAGMLEAGIRGILNPFELFKLAGIIALSSVAMSKIKGLEKGLTGFQEGGVNFGVGPRLLHDREVIHNPLLNTPAQFMERLESVSPARAQEFEQAFGGGDSGTMFQTNSFYGPLNSLMDLRKMGAELAAPFRKARGRGGA